MARPLLEPDGGWVDDDDDIFYNTFQQQQKVHKGDLQSKINKWLPTPKGSKSRKTLEKHHQIAARKQQLCWGEKEVVNFLC